MVNFNKSALGRFISPVISPVISSVVFGAALSVMSFSPSAIAGNTVENHPKYAQLLDAKTNPDAAKSLKWLYENDAEFKRLMDNLFANIHPLRSGKPNPWAGKGMEELYQFVRNWSDFLPLADNGLSYIREFQMLIDTNIYGEIFVQTEPGLSWTRHLANVRRNLMISAKSKQRIAKWVENPRINIDDYVVPEGGFASFNDFFVRDLKQPRHVTRPDNDAIVVSPADCLVMMMGVDFTDSSLITTKVGQNLKVDQLLGYSKYADKFIGGTGLRCILTPTDYHHYHAPVNGEIVESRETVDGVLYGGVPGPKAVDNITNFQRGYYIYKTKEFGYVAMIPVGLATIGSVVFEEKFQHIDDDKPVTITKGEKVGHFEYGGSLVMMLFEPDKFEMLSVEQGSRIGELRHSLGEVTKMEQ